MKAPTPDEHQLTAPSLFQIVARLENPAPADPAKSAPPLNQPFADLMTHPEKVAAVLKTEARESGQNPVKRPTRSAAPKNRDSRRAGKPAGQSPREPKKIEFYLEAPAAKSVKLAADFTDWERAPLDLMPSDDGVWFNAVTLPPGQYAYRFIVDGQWCDDPRSTQHVPNPFGTENAVVVVT